MTSSPSTVDGRYWEETVDDGLFEKATVRESPAEKRRANLKLSPALALPTLPDAVPYCGILFYKRQISDLYSPFNQVKSHPWTRAHSTREYAH